MNRKPSVTVILLSLYAAVLISSVSACSPFYGFNDMVDINVIFSVGKSFWRGRLVYRDLFEHKGPLMYAITAAAALISSADLRGVWVIEIIAAVLSALTAFRILRLLNPKASGLLLPPVLYLIYHSPSFAGGTAENYPLKLGSGTFVPGFEEQLIGANVGDTRDVNIRFPDNYVPELAGHEVVFKVTIKEIQSK